MFWFFFFFFLHFEHSFCLLIYIANVIAEIINHWIPCKGLIKQKWKNKIYIFKKQFYRSHSSEKKEVNSFLIQINFNGQNTM